MNEQRAISVQGSFLCAEAHPDLGGSLLVLAISDSLLTWDDYCKALPATAPTDDDNDAATSNYCVHPAVHAATQKVMHTRIPKQGPESALSCHAVPYLHTGQLDITRYFSVCSVPSTGKIFAHCLRVLGLTVFKGYLQLHVRLCLMTDARPYETQQAVCLTVMLCLQVPIQQLAWLMSDTGCRVIICGKGTAGAIAQAATLQLQQLVRSQSTSQVMLLKACMTSACITLLCCWHNCKLPCTAHAVSH